jgi:hypothetical protein
MNAANAEANFRPVVDALGGRVRSGGTHASVRCPAHDDHNPSLSVDLKNDKPLDTLSRRLRAGRPDHRPAGVWPVADGARQRQRRTHPRASPAARGETGGGGGAGAAEIGHRNTGTGRSCAPGA